MRRSGRSGKWAPCRAVLRRVIGPAVIVSMSLWAIGPAAAAVAPAAVPSHTGSDDLEGAGWIWPAVPFRMERAYEAPAHRYGSGHRGVDLHPMGTSEVRAPADGSIAFVGVVAGRGVLTID